MMRRIWTFLADSRNLTIMGLTAMAALFYLGAQVLELALVWALVAIAVMLALAGGVWGWRRWRSRRDSERLSEAIVDPSVAEVKAIRDSMLKAIDTIKGSKLGMVSGARALYELPWDLASPILLQTCSAGRTIPKAKFEFMRADAQGERVKYYEIEIENVLIGAVSPAVEEGDILSEEVALKFSKIKWKYTQQKLSGGAGGNTSGGWDLATNRIV
jgi:type VI secretion system Hcp family effector